VAAFAAAGALAAAPPTGKQVVDEQCAVCHASGKDGAPKIGDRAGWIPHMRKGLDALVASAIRGHGPMPARGGLADLTDPEIRNAIVAMFTHGLPIAAPATPVVAKGDDPRHRVVAGTDVYLGLMRADALRAQDAKPPVPSGKGYYHVNISLADNKSQAAVSDASVELRVSDGMKSETKPLEPIRTNGAVSYRNYFRLSSGTAYTITASIRRPERPQPVQARFEFKAP
jgi:cytochrome c5